MKKTTVIPSLLIAAMIVMASVSSCSTQKGLLGKIQTVSKVANVVSTAKQISSVLGGTLNLNGDQKSSVTDIFTDYINGTNNIASLSKNKKGSYLKKLTSLNRGTMGKLKGVFTALQYANLLGLGGKKPSISSLIGNLKGGSSLSGSGKSVLSGLLLNGVL